MSCRGTFFLQLSAVLVYTKDGAVVYDIIKRCQFTTGFCLGMGSVTVENMGEGRALSIQVIGTHNKHCSYL